LRHLGFLVAKEQQNKSIQLILRLEPQVRKIKIQLVCPAGALSEGMQVSPLVKEKENKYVFDSH
jgi:hypothetical protein